MVDPGGRFFSQMVYPIRYFIRVDAPGFEGVSKEMNISARQNLNLQFVLSPATYTVGSVTEFDRQPLGFELDADRFVRPEPARPLLR